MLVLDGKVHLLYCGSIAQDAHCCVINVIIWHVMLLLSLAMLMFTEKIYELKTDEWWFDRKSKHV